MNISRRVRAQVELHDGEVVVPKSTEQWLMYEFLERLATIGEPITLTKFARRTTFNPLVLRKLLERHNDFCMFSHDNKEYVSLRSWLGPYNQ